MLIKFKIKSRIAIYYLNRFRIWSQQVLDVILDKLGTTEDSNDLIDVSLKFHLMYDYCYSAICADSCRDLYSDSCLGVIPKSGDPKMLFDSGFDASEHSPVVHAHAKIDCRGIECVELATDAELTVYSGILGKPCHVYGGVEANKHSIENGLDHFNDVNLALVTGSK